jgi:PAS domain S-box-containing protein
VESTGRHDDNPAINGVLVTMRDIGERKLAEAARNQVEKLLLESENKYRTLVDLAGDAIFLADTATGIVIDCNVNATRLIGKSKSEIIGLHQSELHPSGKASLYKKLFRDHVEFGKAITEDVFVAHKDGHTIPVDIHATVFELNGVRVILGIFRDITERRRAEKACWRAKTMQATLDAFRTCCEWGLRNTTLPYGN